MIITRQTECLRDIGTGAQICSLDAESLWFAPCCVADFRARAVKSCTWLRKAYELDPYSKTVVQYICMSHLAALSRMNEADRRGSKGNEQRRSLN